jgi:hypothetical protein
MRQAHRLLASAIGACLGLYGDAPNRYRVGKPYVALNFGLIEIDWEKSTVGLSACGVDGKVAFRQQLVLGNPKG